LRSWRAFSFAGWFSRPGASGARSLFRRRRIAERRNVAVETLRPLWKAVVNSSQVSPPTVFPRTSTREQAPAAAASGTFFITAGMPSTSTGPKESSTRRRSEKAKAGRPQSMGGASGPFIGPRGTRAEGAAGSRACSVCAASPRVRRRAARNCKEAAAAVYTVEPPHRKPQGMETAGALRPRSAGLHKLGLCRRGVEA
jgi:hypothetical protein